LSFGIVLFTIQGSTWSLRSFKEIKSSGFVEKRLLLDRAISNAKVMHTLVSPSVEIGLLFFGIWCFFSLFLYFQKLSIFFSILIWLCFSCSKERERERESTRRFYNISWMPYHSKRVSIPEENVGIDLNIYVFLRNIFILFL